MDRLCAYDIDFLALKGEDKTVHYTADKSFFESLEGAGIHNGEVEVDLHIHPTLSGYTLGVRLKGWVEVVCDRCLEPLPWPIAGESELKVRLGSEAGDDGDIITVPEAEPSLNIAWNLYEQMALLIPLRHVHPEGECAALYAQSAKEESTDPRWEALRNLREDK